MSNLKKYIQNEILNSIQNINYRKLKNIPNDILKEINEFPGTSIQQKLYHIVNDVKDIPICEICNDKECKFINLKTGYVECCSNECSKQLRSLKIKQTCLERYGVDNPNKLKEVKDKKKYIFLNKYGVDNPNKLKEVRDKIEKTCLERYGVKSYLNFDTPRVVTENEKLKRKKTCLEKYGVDSVAKLESIKEKSKQTCLERYGVEHPLQNIKIKEKIRKSNNINHWDTFKIQLLQKNLDILSSLEDYINNSIFKFKCLLCGSEFESSGTSIQHVSCECRKNVSKSEFEIIEWLKSLNINIIISSDRKTIDPLELDIYLPEHNLAIEFDGLYWHSELYKDKNYHLNKTLKCLDKNIELIHIFENEWENKRDIVKSIILNKLGLVDNRLYARKCEVREISNKDYKEFVELNHLQGYVPSKYKIGLYFNGELVQICSFSKNRFKKDEVELIRSCSKLNYRILGGFDKLVQYFINAYKPEKLISYVDRRYFNGNGYKKWKLVHETKPNYWYWKQNSNLHLESRMKYQKHKLKDLLENFNSNLTETENMYNNNYIRIWDCGNLKFEYEEIY